MKKALGFVCTPIFYLAFGLILGIFHPVQVICWNIWGYNAHKRSVDVMNFLLVKSLWIMGASVHFSGFDRLLSEIPLIIVSNHQSMFDIPPIVWGFRKHHPKFISKKELGTGIPSISYNLRKGGSVLIDRDDREQAVKEIEKLGRNIEKNRYSAVIFPEGTRSRNGMLKNFKTGGIGALLSTAPSALVVPFVIDGNYKLQQYGKFPLYFGAKLRYTALSPFNSRGMSASEVAGKAENLIRDYLGQT